MNNSPINLHLRVAPCYSGTRSKVETIPRIPVPGILSLLDSESLTVILLFLDLVLLQIILGNADTPNSSWKFDHLYVSKLEG